MGNLSKFVLAIIIASLCLGCQSNNQSELNATTQIVVNKTKNYLISELNQVLDSLKSDVQVFEIETNKNSIITGKQGTRISIPANSLVNTKKKKVKGKATLYLKENYTIENFVGDNLSTITDNKQQLETAGMVNIQVKQGNEVLMMRSKATYKVYIPNKDKNLKADYKAFYQSVNKDGIVEWKEAEVQSPELKPISVNIEYDYARRKQKVLTASYFEQRFYDSVFENTKSRYWRISSNCNQLNDRLVHYFDDIDKIMYLYNTNDSLLRFKIDLKVDNLGKVQSCEVSNSEQYPLISKYLKHFVCLENNSLNYKKIEKISRIDSTQWLRYGNYFKWKTSDFKKHAPKLLNEFRAKIKDFGEIEHLKNNITEYSASQYIMNLNNFGWINLDRYYKNKNGSTDLQILTGVDKCKVIILFENINSTIQFESNSENSVFVKGLPKNEEVKILALKVIDGSLHTAVTTTKIGEENINLPQMHASTLSQIKEELKN